MRRPPRQKQRQPELKLRRHPPLGPRCHPRPHPPATVVTSDGATGVPPSGVNAWASCDASAIISPTPAAANKNVFLMRCPLSLSIAARRAEKRVPPRNTIDHSAAGTSGRHPIGRLRHRIEESRRGKNPVDGSEQFCTDRRRQVR